MRTKASLSERRKPCGSSRPKYSALIPQSSVLLVAVCAVLFALNVPAAAQQPGKIFRIGFLDPSTASGMAVLVNTLRQELRKFGWIEGKNIIIEYGFAEQRADRLPDLAAELVRLNVDLIVATGGPPTLAAKGATAAIPVVMVTVGDPVALGLVASLARPGGNVNGLSSLNPELNSKRLEILKETIPKLARVGFLRQLVGVAGDNQLKEVRPAGTEAKIGGDHDSTRLQGFRERL
jgi:putative tryptophan/tyrosine transport system substrate-binding protein